MLVAWGDNISLEIVSGLVLARGLATVACGGIGAMRAEMDGDFLNKVPRLRCVAVQSERVGSEGARPKGDLEHMASAHRTQVDAMADQGGAALTIIGSFGSSGRVRGIKSSANLGEFVGAAGVCQEAEVPNAAEAARKNVKQKPADELLGVKGHQLGLVVGAIVLPLEADLGILTGEKTAVGDSDAMGIAPQVIENLLGPSKGAFGIHNPIDVSDGLEIASKRRRFDEARKVAEES
jgi:hypothetical protein